MRARRTSLFVTVAGLASALSACATAPEAPPGPPVATAADRHRIQVAETGQRLELPVAPEEMALDRVKRVDVTRFADTYVRAGTGPLMISTPSGGGNADAASRMAQDVRMALVEAGVSFAAIAASTYDASGSEAAPIVLSYSSFEAIAPDCRPLYEQDLAQNRHVAYESFGCALNANLAAMIEDPRDLLGPRDETPRDAARRAAVLEAYRRGTPTHAVRSADERVVLSDAVQ